MICYETVMQIGNARYPLQFPSSHTLCNFSKTSQHPLLIQILLRIDPPRPPQPIPQGGHRQADAILRLPSPVTLAEHQTAAFQHIRELVSRLAVARIARHWRAYRSVCSASQIGGTSALWQQVNVS